jgi:hypothetical protein
MLAPLRGSQGRFIVTPNHASSAHILVHNLPQKKLSVRRKI